MTEDGESGDTNNATAGWCTCASPLFPFFFFFFPSRFCRLLFSFPPLPRVHLLPAAQSHRFATLICKNFMTPPRRALYPLPAGPGQPTFFFSTNFILITDLYPIPPPLFSYAQRTIVPLPFLSLQDQTVRSRSISFSLSLSLSPSLSLSAFYPSVRPSVRVPPFEIMTRNCTVSLAGFPFRRVILRALVNVYTEREREREEDDSPMRTINDHEATDGAAAEAAG